MKKVICILLVVSLMFSFTTPAFAEETKEPQYGTLKVEYSNAVGSVERLSVMVKDDHVYADAVTLSDRLGYDCTQDGDLVSIYANNNFFYPNAPLLAVHFYANESKVAYNPLFGAEYEYTAPAPCIVNDKGVWVPLTYTLVLLGGNSTILEDTLLVQMPQNNILSIAATIVNNEDTLSFDWISHFGYSETATNVTDGAGRVVTLFSGLLKFDGDAWLSLLDWSAFDKKFGKSLATMFCTNSAEELQESIEQVELLLDVFSPKGKAGEMLRNKQIRIDSDVTAWKNACDEYLELLEQGSGSPTKYNMLYQQYERAVDDQSLFSNLGGDDAIYIQNELSSATNVLDVASKIGSAVSYLREFQQKDSYQISVLKKYLTARTPTDNMPDATVDAMMKYLSSMDSAGKYVFSRFLEDNALDLIVDKSGFDAYLGLPANILLFAWDIMSGTIPFYSDGLKAVENREISNYAQKVQNDALDNLKYLITELKKSPSISAEDCVQLSEYCYVYLKACYIARSSAIKSLDSTSEEFREKIKGKLDVEANINQLTVQYLSLLSRANVENECYILGFLPESNEEYLNNCSDIRMCDDGADVLYMETDFGTDEITYEIREENINFYTSDGKLVYTNTISYPYFEGNSEFCEKLNKRYEEVIESYKINDMNYDELYNSLCEYGQEDTLPYYDNLNVEVKFNERGYLSLLEIYTMWSGGAHPYSDEMGITFKLEDGKECSYAEFILGTESQRLKLSEVYFESEMEGDQPIDDFYTYTLTNEGVCLYYWMGDAVAPVEIIIPYTDKESCTVSADKALKKIESQQKNNSEIQNGDTQEEKGNIEAEVQNVREIYYGIQNNLESFEKQDGGNIVRYVDSEGYIRKIIAHKGAYSGYDLSNKYSVEYYYDIDQKTGQYSIRFIFVFGNNEEHRFYFDKNMKCIRYIDSDRNIQDFQPPLDSLELEDVTELYQFRSFAQLEISWAMEERIPSFG